MRQTIFDKINRGERLAREEIIALLNLADAAEREALYQKAYAIKRQHVGTTVYFRGIIEFSNVCAKDCFYCGIRKSNPHVERYQMTQDEIVNAAIWAHQRGYGSIVLQSGERGDAAFAEFVEQTLLRIRERSGGELGVTLSLGEQSDETYQRWFYAGAHRYLLRIETSNPELYAKLHPADHSFERRRACLDALRRIGYQVGTGVMIGLPFQTTEHLADDILFFQRQDIDMIGMGPYLPHRDTPLAAHVAAAPDFEERQLAAGLNMIAVTRIVLQDVNIAATTALQALRHDGRELGLLAGANIIMPNITDTQYRAAYQLYQNKPCLDENAAMCQACLEGRIALIGETVGYGKRGDSPHFAARIS